MRNFSGFDELWHSPREETSECRQEDTLVDMLDSEAKEGWSLESGTSA